MPGTESHATIETIWRIEAPKLIGGLTRLVRDVGRAEDLAHDALVAALEQWPREGVPQNPGAWLMQTAKHRAIDHLRRTQRVREKHAAIGYEARVAGYPEFDAVLDDDVGDDVLRLMFTACHPVLSALGPDLCLPEVDLDEVAARLARLDPGTEVGVALLDQTVASGVGNVYRAEVLWACRVEPFRRLQTLDETTRRSLYDTAHRLLRSNLTRPRRTTVPSGLAVYERTGRPCPRCAEPIEVRRQGEQASSRLVCQLPCRLLQLLLGARHDGQVNSFPSQFACDRLTDAAATARDHGATAGDAETLEIAGHCGIFL